MHHLDRVAHELARAGHRHRFGQRFQRAEARSQATDIARPDSVRLGFQLNPVPGLFVNGATIVAMALAFSIGQAF
jgi:hypothetical protein